MIINRRYINFILVTVLILVTLLPTVTLNGTAKADVGDYGNVGGTITTDGAYTIHTFNLSQTGTNFSACTVGNIEVLVVAGGGAGYRGGAGGGGGAGGLVYHPNKSVTTGNYTVTVGNGGQTTGSSGGNSSFSDILALGGGGGGSSSPGNNGGCGGGGSQVGQAGGVATQGNSGGGTGYGRNGGPGINVYGGGGGGVGAVGGTPSGGRGGAGGSGTSNYSSILSVVGIGQNVSGTWWIGGGGGGNYQASDSNKGGAGGLGGGGDGAHYSGTSNAVVGSPNTGGGGGAGDTGNAAIAKGGSGIVIIRCLTSDFTEGVVLTTSSSSGGNVSTPGEGTYVYNASEVVNISATADDYYSFVNWTGNTSTIADVNSSSTTITMSADCSIVANFEETVVDFPDSALETAVRSAVSVPSGDIHELDLQGVTSFNATSLGIEDLTGMEYWVPLETLNLSTNDIVDVAPLAPLVDLTYLDLNDNSVSNISPIAMESGDLFVKSNPLSSKAYTTYIPALLGGGVDVEYDEQPALAISVSPISKNFGKMYANTSYWSNGSTPTFPLDDAECYFIITNEGSATINISINASDFTGGAGWALTSGTPGSGEARMKAGVSGDANEGAMIILTASPASFMTSMAGNASVSWELKLETGIFTDGVVKESHITLVAVEDI